MEFTDPTLTVYATDGTPLYAPVDLGDGGFAAVIYDATLEDTFFLA